VIFLSINIKNESSNSALEKKKSGHPCYTSASKSIGVD